MTRVRPVSIALALVLAACTASSGTPSGSTTSSSAPSAGASASALAEGLADVVFNRQGVLFTINADGTEERQVRDSWDGIGLSKDGTALFSPAPAPDGRLLPLVVAADGPGEYWFPLADPTLQLGIGDWSPDGSRLVFDAWDDTDTSRKGLYTVSLEGDDLVRLTDPGVRHDWPAYTGAYSPGGGQVLFFRPVAEEDGDRGPMNLFVTNVDGIGLVQLNPPGTQTGLVGPSGASDWSPDGQQVAFVASDGDFWSADPKAVFVVNADGSNPVRVTEWASDVLTVQWSPDGQLLALTTAGPTGSQEIATIRPDGTDLVPVTSSDTGTFSFGAMWSSDSSQLLYVRGPDLRSNMDLWIVNTDGTNPVQITYSSSEVGGYEWVP